jgi:integrase/recombinase XerC
MFGSTTLFRTRGKESVPDIPARICRSSILFAWCRAVTSAVQKQTSDFLASVDAWIAALSRSGRAPNTLDCYGRDIRQFRQAVAGISNQAAILDMSGIGQEEIDLVAATWQTGGASAQTISRRFSAVKGFAAYLSLVANVNCSRILAAQFPAGASGRVPPVEAEDMRVITTTSPDDDSWIHLRNSAAFSAMACGLTTGETTNLDMVDVDVRGRVAMVRQTTLRPRPVPLTIDAGDSIVRYLEAIPRLPKSGQPIFQTTRGTRLSTRSLQAAFRLRRRVLGLSDAIVPSSLRHAAGRERAERWRSPAAVGRLLGIDTINARRYFE